MRILLTYDQVRALYDNNGYPFSDHAINVFGIRNEDMTVDKWNDTLGIVCPGKEVLAFSGTTDPGASPLSKIEGVNANGIFILMRGFYANCFHKGLHHGKYRALVQYGSGIFKGWRDNNHDGKLDLTGNICTDVQGLNFHTTRWDKKVMRVGDFSEACQVTEVAQEYDLMIEKIYASTQSIFSYALL
jgi:hypothetical protein